MAERLNIYACSGIGDANAPRYDYWTDNTNTLNNTQAVNNLLVSINLLMAKVECLDSLSKKDIIRCLNAIDLYVVCLDAAQNYATHYTKLEKAGKVIGTMLAQDQFDCDSIENDERDEHLDELLAWFKEAMDSDGQYVLASNEFMRWFDENVITLNKVGLSANERNTIQSTLKQAISGIGAMTLQEAKSVDWTKDPDLAKYLSNAGTYFLYTYFTDAQINKLPVKNRTTIKLKRSDQNYTYNFCKDKFVGIYGTETAYKNIIRTGIIAEFGAEPESVCEDIATGKRSVSGIGMATAVIVAIISACVAVVTALITGICEAVARSNEARYKSLDDKIVGEGVPNPDDFDGLSMESGGTSTSASALDTTTAGDGGTLPLIIIGAAAAFMLLKR